MRKGTLTIVALLVLSLLLAACGSQSNQATTAAATTAAATTTAQAAAEQQTTAQTEGTASQQQAGTVNKYGWEVPEETLEFSVYAGKSDPEVHKTNLEESNYIMVNFLLDEFNVKIDKQVYLDEIDQRLNLMLLSGDYPDVLTNLPEVSAQNFIDSGSAIELTDLLDKYGANIKIETDKYLSFYENDKGEYWHLPAGYGMKVDTVGQAFSMRYDWWLELGADVYRTPEEYYEQLKQTVENHPVNEDGRKVYGISDYDEGGTVGFDMLKAMFGAWGFYNEYAVSDDNAMTYWMFDDRAKEIALYANRFWLDDMIDPDIVTNEYEDVKTICSVDRVAGYMGMWWKGFVFGHEYWQQLDQGTPVEKRYMNVTVTAPGISQHTMATANFISEVSTVGGSKCWLITDKCKDPEMVMKYLDWESSPWGTLIAWNGVPGPDNIYNIVGNDVVMKEESLDASNKNIIWHLPARLNGRNHFNLVSRRSALSKGFQPLPYNLDPRVAATFGSGECYPRTADLTAYLDPGWNICWQWYDESPLWDGTAFMVLYPADNPVSIIKQNTDEIAKTEFLNILTANSADAALAALESAKAKMEQAGIRQLEEYRTESYRKNIEILGE